MTAIRLDEATVRLQPVRTERYIHQSDLWRSRHELRTAALADEAFDIVKTAAIRAHPCLIPVPPLEPLQELNLRISEAVTEQARWHSDVHAIWLQIADH